MKKSVYYTPDETEFFIGFEYEGMTEDGLWEKTIFKDGRSEEYYEENRVKKLDKADFLSFDFNSQVKRDDAFGKIEVFTKKIGSEFAFEMKIITVKSVDGNFLFEIEEIGRFSRVTNQFWIELKNKSELKKLLKQLKLIR